MRLKSYFFIGVLLLTAIAAACSKPETASPPASNTAAKPEAAKAPAADGHEEKPEAKGEDIPPEVKAAFPEAQTISKQHKDLTAGQIASIEKGSGSKLDDTDFHNYVAYGMEGGKRTQLGAATIVDIEGAGAPMQLLVVYSNDIVIKKISVIKGSGDAASPAFLNQFAGKDHDQKFHVGADLKYSGSNKESAEAVAHALKRDILAMQALYGKAHTH